MCMSQRLDTSPLSTCNTPRALRAPRLPRQVPRHQRNPFFSVKKGCLNTLVAVWTVCHGVSRLTCKKRVFIGNGSKIVTGWKGGGALGTLCSTDDLFDRFCCQHWWWLMLIPNSTGLSWRWMSFYWYLYRCLFLLSALFPCSIRLKIPPARGEPF